MSARAIRHFLRQLRHNDDAVRSEACDGLARFGPLAFEAVEGLTKLLADHNNSVRSRAANALGRIGPAAKNAVPTLIDKLTDYSPAVRSAAAKAIGRMGSVAVPQLITALRYEPGEDERAAAARALAALGPEAGVAVHYLTTALHDPELPVRVQAARALAALGQPVDEYVPTLIAILEQESAEHRPGLAEALASFRPVAEAAVPLLVRLLPKTGEENAPTVSPKVQAHAMQALGKLGTAAGAAVPTLLDVLALPDSPLRSPALVALGRMGPAAAAATPTLTELLTGQGEKYTLLTVEALGRIGPAAAPAVPKLLEMLTAAYGEMRDAIMAALGQIGAAEAAPVLQRAAKDKTPAVRVTALQTLARLGPAARAARTDIITTLEDPESTVRLAALQTLTALDTPIDDISERLQDLLQDRNASVRRAAARLLAKDKTAGKSVATKFKKNLDSPYAVVRQDAAEILWYVTGQSDQSVVALKEGLHDDDRAVRQHTLELLAQMAARDQNAIPLLVQALKNPDEPLGRPAANALLKLGIKAVPPLSEALKDKNVAVRNGALQVLARLGPKAEAAVQGLLDGLQDEEGEVRWAAIRAIAHVGRGGATLAPVLAPMLTDSDDTVRNWAALALGRLGADAVPHLLPFVDDSRPSARAAAGQALAYMGAPAMAALSAVGGRLQDEDDVKEWMRRALTEMGRDVRPKVEGLLRLLGSPLDSYRDWAALMLGSRGSEVLPLLMERLADGDEYAQRGACEAMTLLGPDAGPAVPLLVNTMAEATGVLLPEALARALGAAASGAVLSLIAALGHKSPKVRIGVLDALARIGPAAESAVPALIERLQVEDNLAVQQFVGEVLARCGSGAVEALRQSVSTTNPAETARVARAFGIIGSPARAALPELLNLLGHSDAIVRREAAWTIGRVGATGSAAAATAVELAKLTRDGDARVREQAAVALGRLGADAVKSLPTVLELLKSPDATQRQTAALAAGDLVAAGGKEALKALVAAAEKDSDPTVRATAVRGLANVDHGSAKEVLAVCRKALDDSDPGVRLRAVETAATLGGQAEPLLRSALEQPIPLVRRTAFQALVGLEPADLTTLLTERLSDRDWGISQLCAERLGTLGEAGRATVPTLCLALKSRVKSVREAALKSLQTLDPDGVQIVPALTEALAEKNLPVRAWAAEQLGKYRDRAADAVPLLVLLAPGWQAGVGAKAAAAVQQIGAAAVPGIITALTQPEEKARERAISGMARIHHATYSAMQPFKEQLGSPPPPVMKKLNKSLEGFGEESAGAGDPTDSLTRLRKELKNKGSWWQRYHAAQQIARLGVKALPALDDLIKALKDSDDDVREWSAKALGQIGPAAEKAVSALVENLDDSDDDARTAALTALSKIGHAPPDAVDKLLEVFKEMDEDDTPDSELVKAAAEMLGSQAAPPPPPAVLATTAVPVASALRTFTYSDAKSNKFWNIELQGKAFTVTFGRLGTDGQTQVKEFPSEEKARKEHDKLVKEKLGKGYTETTSVAASTPAPAPVKTSKQPTTTVSAAMLSSVLPLLVRLSRTTDDEARAWVAWALGQLLAVGKSAPEAADGVAALRRLAEDGHPLVEAWAAGALLRATGDSESVLPAVTRLIPCAHPNVRHGVADTVRQLGEASLPALRQALAQPDLRYRAGVLEVLGKVKDRLTAASDLLGQLASGSEDELKQLAETALNAPAVEEPTASRPLPEQVEEND